jgi:hypothetical protein
MLEDGRNPRGSSLLKVSLVPVEQGQQPWSKLSALKLSHVSDSTGLLLLESEHSRLTPGAKDHQWGQGCVRMSLDILKKLTVTVTVSGTKTKLHCRLRTRGVLFICLLRFSALYR